MKPSFIAAIKVSAKPRGSYVHFTPAQRFKIGKPAAEHSDTATIHYYKKRFPELALKETTVRCIKNLYLKEIKKRPVNEFDALKELCTYFRVKEDGPCLLVKPWTNKSENICKS